MSTINLSVEFEKVEGWPGTDTILSSAGLTYWSVDEKIWEICTILSQSTSKKCMSNILKIKYFLWGGTVIFLAVFEDKLYIFFSLYSKGMLSKFVWWHTHALYGNTVLGILVSWVQAIAEDDIWMLQSCYFVGTE